MKILGINCNSKLLCVPLLNNNQTIKKFIDNAKVN